MDDEHPLVLHKLENEGVLESFWQDMKKGPARKYYQLTEKGAKRLEIEKAQWFKVHEALTSLWGPQSTLSPL